ncbi:WD40 repeat-like protein [Cryphonectria parasitica EP155]|uniref:WD40 repeat-like protein n=1 Tax=Cryphonectria parasitica (strain ATCC 38755 / EP155) TaxID=660469 RepID=A0A9P4Y167_CRYP1|nr:WD40 repeat-like protein [Cryphonectria parasitica EP155]KAF3764773.1 WD40 repeat-like protein [Cryphonectria parasitica EP155]
MASSSNKPLRAPLLRPRQSLNKDRFQVYFNAFRPQAYTEPTATRGASNHNIRSIGWNPFGNLIATGAADKTLRVWNPERANVRFSTELKGHAAPIEKVAFNPVKDAELCSVSNDGTVKFWDVRTKNCVNEVKGLGEAFTLVWDPEGESLIVGNKADNVFVLSPTQSTPIANHQQAVQTNQIAFCWSRERVYVGTGKGEVRVLSFPDFEPVIHYSYDRSMIDGPGATNEYALKGHTGSCLSVELSPSGKYLASGGTDSLVSLYDTRDWMCHRTLTDLIGPVKTLSFTWDGFYLVAGSDVDVQTGQSTGIDCYHCESGERVHTFKTASSTPVVSWAPTRYQLAYSDVGQLRIVGVDLEKDKK